MSEKIVQAKKRQAPRSDWRKCCATCEHLDDKGWCEKFDDHPPLDFIEQTNDCEFYLCVVPF